MAALKGRLFRSATVFSSGFDGHRASVLACRRMPRPRAILFDLDDTLIHAHARPEAAWR